MIQPPHPYAAIPCLFHDRLLHYATLRQPVRVQFRDAAGLVQEEQEVIVDVWTHGGAEWLRLGSGTVMRLDVLVAVEGFEVGDGGMCAV